LPKLSLAWALIVAATAAIWFLMPRTRAA
jgi:hypothetical protein